MAIEYASTSIIGRSKGHSAIKASAYRSGEKMYDERNSQSVDYAHRKHEVVHSEILIPSGADNKYKDRETLWNSVEGAEKRKDSQLAKDHVIALPRELDKKHHIAMATQFANEQYVDKGVAVDLNIHYHSEDNPHAHLMTTTRVLDENGLGKKALHLNPEFSGKGRVSADKQIRHEWADFQNKYYQENNIGIEVSNNNGEYKAQVHMGDAHAMEKRGIKTEKGDYNREIKAEKIAELERNPDKIIDVVSDKKSVFSKHDLYRELHKQVDDSEAFQSIKAKLDTSEILIQVDNKGDRKGTFYTTEDVIDTEQDIRAKAEKLGREDSNHGVSKSIRNKVLDRHSYLSEEQKASVEDVTDDKRLSIVVGLAGAGKSTMFKTAKESWEESGYTVRGVALSGKASEGFEESSGIKSSTIHRMIYEHEEGYNPITKKTVLAMDEAGMINNKLMQKVVNIVDKTGAKLVLAGDSEQLQPIQAGNPFRDMSEINGYTEISTIRRQSQKWQQEATRDMSRGRSEEAVRSYANNGDIRLSETHNGAIGSIVKDYLKETGSRQNMAVLAHKRVDVALINLEIRDELKKRGDVHSQVDVKTKEGKKQFGIGDRILFTKNDKNLGVSNGTLGTIEKTIEGTSQFKVNLDSGKQVDFNTNNYEDVTHGYAMTLHKAQGVTVDKTKVLATRSFDKHLAYVAMSRHKHDLKVYAGKDEFKDTQAMARQFKRLNRQESIHSFAEKHGYEPENNDKNIVDTLKKKADSKRALKAQLKDSDIGKFKPKKELKESKKTNPVKPEVKTDPNTTKPKANLKKRTILGKSKKIIRTTIKTIKTLYKQPHRIKKIIHKIISKRVTRIDNTGKSVETNSRKELPANKSETKPNAPTTTRAKERGGSAVNKLYKNAREGKATPEQRKQTYLASLNKYNEQKKLQNQDVAKIKTKIIKLKTDIAKDKAVLGLLSKKQLKAVNKVKNNNRSARRGGR